MRNLARLFILLGLLPTTATVHARWAKPEEAEAILESTRDEVWIEKDGSFRERTEVSIRIASEAKRQDYATYRFEYNRRSGSYRVVQAETIVDGKHIPVSDEMIEDRLVSEASVGENRDDAAFSIAFPAVVVGSTIHFTLESEGKRPLVPGYFFSFVQVDPALRTDKQETIVHAKSRLYTNVYDPEHWFDIEPSDEGEGTRLRVALRKPVFHWAVEEPQVFFYAREIPRVEFSTFEHPFEEVARHVAPQFEAELQRPLPDAFVSIRARAEKKAAGAAQLEYVMAEIGKQVRYHRERLELAYDLHPRTLERIAQTGFGDCKDFSITLTAILRQLGWEALPAIVTWGPNAARFLTSGNHAIVWAKAKSGETFWVDPTTGIGAARELAEELSDRPAFVLLGDHAERRDIPPADPKRNEWLLEREYWPKRGERTFRYTFRAEWRGLFALPFIGRTLWEGEVIELLPDSRQFTSHTIEPYDYTSKIYQPVTFRGTARVKDPSIKTSLGKGFYWGPGRIEELLLQDFSARVSHLDAETPGRRTYRVLLRGAKVVGKPIGCRVQSQWFDGLRAVERTPEGIAITDDFFVKRRVIRAEELKSAPFRRFQTELENCYGPSAVLYKL